MSIKKNQNQGAEILVREFEELTLRQAFAEPLQIATAALEELRAEAAGHIFTDMKPVSADAIARYRFDTETTPPLELRCRTRRTSPTVPRAIS